MQSVLTIMVVLAMLATLGILFTGLIGFVRGNTTPAQSNTLMRWRVLAQAGAILLFVLLLALVQR